MVYKHHFVKNMQIAKGQRKHRESALTNNASSSPGRELRDQQHQRKGGLIQRGDRDRKNVRGSTAIKEQSFKMGGHMNVSEGCSSIMRRTCYFMINKDGLCGLF